MADTAKVKALAAAVRVNVLGPDGKPTLQVTGVDAEGKAVTGPLTSVVYIERGAELPDNIVAGEEDRLRELDAVGSAAEVDEYLRRLADPAAAGEADRAAASARLALQVGDAGPLDPANLAAATDQQLAAWIRDESPTIDAVADAVGDDPALAARVLEAENTATGGDPRAGLVTKLEKVRDAAAATPTEEA